MKFPFKPIKHPVTYFECGMCGLPANYQCEDCQQCLREEMEASMADMPQERKIFIGSGEDVCLSLLEAC